MVQANLRLHEKGALFLFLNVNTIYIMSLHIPIYVKKWR